MPRSERVIGSLVAAVVLIGLLVLLFGPDRGVRNDIGAQRELIAAQLATLDSRLQVVTLQLEETRSTRKLTGRNLEEVTRTRELTEEGLAEGRRTRELAEQTLEQALAGLEIGQRTPVAVENIQGDVKSAVALLREQTALTRELLQVARASLERVREINRKTVPAGSALPVKLP